VQGEPETEPAETPAPCENESDHQLAASDAVEQQELDEGSCTKPDESSMKINIVLNEMLY
jgi:hypothetical protein